MTNDKAVGCCAVPIPFKVGTSAAQHPTASPGKFILELPFSYSTNENPQFVIFVLYTTLFPADLARCKIPFYTRRACLPHDDDHCTSIPHLGQDQLPELRGRHVYRSITTARFDRRSYVAILSELVSARRA